MSELVHLNRKPLWMWGAVLVTVGTLILVLGNTFLMSELSQRSDTLALVVNNVIFALCTLTLIPAGAMLMVIAGVLAYAERSVARYEQ